MIPTYHKLQRAQLYIYEYIYSKCTSKFRFNEKHILPTNLKALISQFNLL